MTGSGGHCRHCRNPHSKKAEKHLLAATLNHRTQKRAHFFDLSDAAFFWLAHHSARTAGSIFVGARLRVRTMRSLYFDSLGSFLVLRLPHGLTANGSCVSENAPGYRAAPRFRVGSCFRLEREPHTHGRLRIGLTRSSRAQVKSALGPPGYWHLDKYVRHTGDAFAPMPSRIVAWAITAAKLDLSKPS
jgi:hypothetical protein